MALRPSNITAEEAAAVPVSALTAWQAMFGKAGLRAPAINDQNGNHEAKQARILINGASGAVGLWMIQLAKLANIEVIATCSAKNDALVKSLGADETVDYTKTSIREWSRDNPRVDMVFDNVGGKSCEGAWHALRKGGKLFTIVPPADMQWKWVLDTPKGIDQSISGEFFVMGPNGEQLGVITKLIEAGLAKSTVDSVYKLDDYQAAFDRVASKRAVGKVVLKVSE
jgi:NADPH:quinone reductase-like Zn-dependent oxidoreductase